MVRKVDPLKKEIDALFESVPKKNQNLNDLLVDIVNENSADSDAYETGKGGNKKSMIILVYELYFIDLKSRNSLLSRVFHNFS